MCGERRVAAVDASALTNPTHLVEVTSASTEDYDRGEKLGHYKQLPSLAAVLIVSHRRPQLTVAERVGTEWRQPEVGSGETLSLEQPPLQLAVDDVYAGVELA